MSHHSIGYGRGREIELTFNQFLDRLENGDESIYLTTQELQYTLEDEPLLLSPPVQGLCKDFSLTPKLMGNLLLQNVNLWMGNSTRPSTSGLHHDYHDNLYILLRGKKTFYLYSYDDIDGLYPTGEVLFCYSSHIFAYNHRIYPVCSFCFSLFHSHTSPYFPLSLHV